MADRLSTSISRVGRPRTKSVCQTPCVTLGKPEVGRPRSKSAHTSKVTDSSKIKCTVNFVEVLKNKNIRVQSKDIYE